MPSHVLLRAPALGLPPRPCHLADCTQDGMNKSLSPTRNRYRHARHHKLLNIKNLFASHSRTHRISFHLSYPPAAPHCHFVHSSTLPHTHARTHARTHAHKQATEGAACAVHTSGFPVGKVGGAGLAAGGHAMSELACEDAGAGPSTGSAAVSACRGSRMQGACGESEARLACQRSPVGLSDASSFIATRAQRQVVV